MLYIARSNGVKQRRKSRCAFWKKETQKAAEYQRENGELSKRHRAFLRRKLKHTTELMAFHDALFLETQGLSLDSREKYLSACCPIFMELAETYQKRSSMERAFFAYMISVCCQNVKERGNLIRILISCLEHSTVFLREHVLRALFTLGDLEGIERAFAELTEHRWKHNVKLVSDGMALYPGDPQMLVTRLWSRRDQWMTSLSVAVVQYAAAVSGDFSREFFQALTNPKTQKEIRFALIRYFHRRPWAPCAQFLCSLAEKEGEELAIAAAFALDAYPGPETRAALKKALSSANWYVRRNAALSLCRLGVTEEDREEIRTGKDPYAWEMLEYAIEETREASSC